MCGILATFFFLRSCLTASLYMSIIQRYTVHCAIACTRGSLGCWTRVLFLVAESGDWMSYQICLAWNSYYLSLFLIVLAITRLKLTAVTGIRTCYCVYFRVHQLYSNGFVLKKAPVCSLVCYLTAFRRPCFLTSPNISCECHFVWVTPLLCLCSSFKLIWLWRANPLVNQIG